MNNLKARCEHGWRGQINCLRCRDLDSAIANDVAENIRLTVLLLLHTSNPDESIVGACNNSEMIKQLLRDERDRLKSECVGLYEKLGDQEMELLRAEQKIAQLQTEIEALRRE